LEEYKVSELKVVTWKSLVGLMGISSRMGSTLIKNTRVCYNKPRGAITLGQVLRANNLHTDKQDK
jgi:ribosomal protein L35AE/L33A